MKLIFIFLCGKFFFFGAHSFAFPTHLCPQVIKLSIQSFDLAELSQGPESYDKKKLEVLERVQSQLNRLGRLQVKYTLQFAGGAKCYYEGHNQTGQYFRAHIQMENSHDGRSLWFITKSDSYAVKAQLASFDRSGINPSTSEVELSSYEKSCPQRGCPMTYTYLGTGNIRELK